VATYPEGVVALIRQGSPAHNSDLQLGDKIETINGVPFATYADPCNDNLKSDTTENLLIRRAGENELRKISINLEELPDPSPTGRRLNQPWENIGYLEVLTNYGTELYPTEIQSAIHAVDESPTCGWIVDLRRIDGGGDLWTYLAGLGPILGEGELGGFVYLDQHREPWSYQDGKVFWGEEERFENYIRGSIYTLKKSSPPVALLISEMTFAAGELVVVAFQGRPDVRTFGEPTYGNPYLTDWTELSDGGQIVLSGAISEDRLGNVYDGPLTPDELVTTEWSIFGSDQDPVLQAAASWLAEHPKCGG
jgi:C-terminal processing protease CtpA/Prc